MVSWLALRMMKKKCSIGNWQKRLHYSESQVTVNVMYDGKRLLQMLYLEHVSPTQVEYAALNDYDERKAGLLQIVRQLYSD